MKTISILPEAADFYRAIAGDYESVGRTPGEALDAFRSQMAGEEGGTIVIVQEHKPDRFFNAERQQRLAELMQRREAGRLWAEEERELESLVEAELIGARDRADFMEKQLSDQIAELLGSLERRAADRAARPEVLIQRSTGGLSQQVKPDLHEPPGKTDSER